jgi:hypothetical protein
MGNVRTFTAIFLLALLPSACTEDENWSNLEKAINVDNNFVLDKPGGDLKEKVKTDLKLQRRVMAIRTEIETAMAPDFEASMEVGRQILRSRGVDPDTAFASPNDPGLALVPAITDYLDSLNQQLYSQGLQVADVIVIPDGQPAQTVSGNSISITQNVDFGTLMVDCLVSEGSKIGIMVAGALYGLKEHKVAGKLIMRGVSASRATYLLGAMYLSYRWGRCTGEAYRGETDCSVTKRLPCSELLKYGPDGFPEYVGPIKGHPYWRCAEEQKALIIAKMATLELQLADTLSVAATL